MSSELNTIFQNMDLGKENVEEALEWLKEEDYSIFGVEDPLKEVVVTSAIDGQFLYKVHLPKFPLKKILELKKHSVGQYILKSLAKTLKEEENLLSQLEHVSRGVPINVTKNRALPTLINCLTNNNLNILTSNDEKLFILMDDTAALETLGEAIVFSFFQPVVLLLGPRISATVMAILHLALGESFPEENLVLPIPVNYQDESLKTDFPAFIHKKFSSCIVFEDTDLESACSCVMEAVWGYEGMSFPLRNIYVQENILDDFLARLKDRMRNFSKVFAFIEPEINKIRCLENFNINGYTLMVGGFIESAPDAPTLANVVSFRHVDEVIGIVNKKYSGISIWTENFNLAQEMAFKLNTNNVWLNCYGLFEYKFGSIKASKDNSWSKLTTQQRIKALKKHEFPENISKVFQLSCDNCVNALIFFKNNYKLESYLGPLDVTVAVSDDLTEEQAAEIIIRALILGNKVVINNKNTSALAPLIQDPTGFCCTPSENLKKIEFKSLTAFLEVSRMKNVWSSTKGNSFF